MISFIFNYLRVFADSGGWTPVTSAADYGNADVVRVIGEADVNMEQLDGNGWSALHAAARRGHTAVRRSPMGHP